MSALLKHLFIRNKNKLITMTIFLLFTITLIMLCLSKLPMLVDLIMFLYLFIASYFIWIDQYITTDNELKNKKGFALFLVPRTGYQILLSKIIYTFIESIFFVLPCFIITQVFIDKLPDNIPFSFIINMVNILSNPINFILGVTSITAFVSVVLAEKILESGFKKKSKLSQFIFSFFDLLFVLINIVIIFLLNEYISPLVTYNVFIILLTSYLLLISTITFFISGYYLDKKLSI